MSTRLATRSAFALALLLASACRHAPPTATPAPAPPRANVGYGTRSVAAAGGAVQTATTEQLKNASAGRAEDLLDGRFPGVHVLRGPSGGVWIRIRGASRLTPDQEPLYVIDGTPVAVTPGRGLDFLAPPDIARIDVLRNPAETSMFGARGMNGVVLITTKRRN